MSLERTNLFHTHKGYHTINSLYFTKIVTFTQANNKFWRKMMTIGSARIDEYGKATGGKAGDQKQKV